jgi:enediyne polyketide synthase
LVARELKENTDAAAARIWTALEALKKAGASADAALTFRLPAQSDAWAVLDADAFTVATVVARAGPLFAIAVAVRRP